MLDSIRPLFRSLAPAVDFCSLRVVDERSEQLMVRHDVLQPLSSSVDRGAMVTIMHRGGYGYAATSDLTAAGLKDAIARAQAWAEASAGRSVVDYATIALPHPHPSGRYGGARQDNLEDAVAWPRKDLIALLMQESNACRIDAHIVDWYAALAAVTSTQLYLTTGGADVLQQFRYVMPNLAVTANQGADTQTRSLGGQYNGYCRQDMFGHFQYGSDLLNVTYDPTRPEQFASYQWDDDGQPAEKTFVIRDGVLQRPLGGATSQARAGVEGVATARACSWNRPPIDRMANLNIEPGNSALDDMIKSVERGVLMDTNVSWSIEWDRGTFRAKFAGALQQFALLKRPPITVPPGAYRAYLTPTALNESVGMFNWDGFSEKALRTRHSALRRMRDEGMQFHPAVTLTEDTGAGLAPGFQGDGFIKPERVTVLEGGRLADSMISPRSAMEYGITANGADGGEAMSSIDLAAGDLPLLRVLAELDTGICVSNLWYLNFSDRANCRLTGMTRFATFWVEGGEIKAPLNVMRFDESAFHLLGDKLIGLTREREFLIDSDSYNERHTSSARLPGALVMDFNFVS